MSDFPTVQDAATIAGEVAAVVMERARNAAALAPDELELLLAYARKQEDAAARELALAALRTAADAGGPQSVGETAALASVLLTAAQLAGDADLRERAAQLLVRLAGDGATATTDALARAAAALLQASWTLDDGAREDAAMRLAEALAARARAGDGLLRRIADPDAADEPALADQVEAGRALLDAYEVTGRAAFLSRSRALADATLAYFGDVAATVAGNAQDKARAAEWLARLSMATAEAGYQEQAKAVLEALRELPVVQAAGPTAGAYALACLRVAEEPVHIVIPGALDDPRTRGLLQAALRVDHWHRLAQAADPDADGELLDALGYYAGPQPMAYVCYNLTCSPPIADPAQIAPAVTRMAANSFAAADAAPDAPAPAPFLNLGGGLGRGPIIGFGPGSGGLGTPKD